MKTKPSIFNDVIGPVMRGPSSSHVAAAARIGAMVRSAVQENIKNVLVEFDVNGSLAYSYDGHGTDMGFICGILDIPLTDKSVSCCKQTAQDRNIKIDFKVSDYGASHPNFYRITAQGEDVFHMDAISTGGGMIEIVSVNEFAVSMMGDYFEYCFIFDNKENLNFSDIENFCRKTAPSLQYVFFSRKDNSTLLEIKTNIPLENETVEKIKDFINVNKYFYLPPVLPILSGADTKLPFSTIEELEIYNKDKNLSFADLAVLYETKRGFCSEEKVYDLMENIINIMRSAIKSGLEKNFYPDRILQSQAYLITENNDKLIPCNITNKIIQYITAVMETKSSMGVIVAAPTAGSCGCLPGTLLAVGECLGKSDREIANAMFAAGLVGVFFCDQATFAAEVGGCQVECGAASAMAAAGLCQLIGGNWRQVMDSASFALQAVTGLACDPVANRVEVPCLNKNIMGGVNAVSSTNVILAGFDKVIPLQQTIKAVYEIGQLLPGCLRCTCGGLGKTEESENIKRNLEQKAQ